MYCLNYAGCKVDFAKSLYTIFISIALTMRDVKRNKLFIIFSTKCSIALTMRDVK